MDQIRVVQWNVFEDGLTDTPGAIGFSHDFEMRFAKVLASISQDEAGASYYGFAPARVFTQLPAVTAINTPSAFLGFINDVYNVVYHALGGELRFGTCAPGEGPDLGNSLRSLFLKTALPEPSLPPCAANPWVAQDFENELQRVVGALETTPESEAWASCVRGLAERSFDPAEGTLVWERATLQGMWKRQDNVFVDKIGPDVAIFLQAAQSPCEDEATQAAMDHFCTLREDSAEAKGSLAALLELQVDGDGALSRIRTLTLQSAMWHLLERLCVFSLGNDDAASALAEFSHFGTAEDLPATPEARAALIFAPLQAEVRDWFEKASLPNRHACVCAKLLEERAGIVTLIEYNAPWRRMPLPDGPFGVVHGKGQASIIFNTELFEPLPEISGITLPRAFRSVRDIGAGDCTLAPKSSCLVLLQCRGSGTLIIVGAVHLDSAPPADSKKVLVRQAQIKSVLAEVSLAARSLAEVGQRCLFILGGDFNALREEFVLGNGDDFYAAPGVAAVRPRMDRPLETVPPLEPAVAELAEDGSLRLLCDGIDGGALREVSYLRCADGVVPCTRAGKSMVIDFLFAGHVGLPGVQATTHELVSAADAAAAADPTSGVHWAVMQWGSDHLPVACDVGIGVDSAL